jgi:putative nucleotidyltransferase with HDIG domain
MVAVAMTNSAALARAQATAAELNHAYLSMLAVLGNAIEARDHYTVGHTWRVARFAQVAARRLGWSECKLAEIEVGGLLHDIGKIGVPDSILTKQGPLDADEQARMKLHPTIGARMLRDVPSLEHVLPYVLSHHENYDGSGYPDGLAGEAIPPEARLLAVVDAFDAMTSTRPYRRGMAVEVAIQRLEQAAGGQLDPTIVAAVVAAWQAGELAPNLATEQQAQHQVPCPHCSTWFTPAPGSDANRCRCPTCHRHLRLVAEAGALRAELA